MRKRWSRFEPEHGENRRPAQRDLDPKEAHRARVHVAKAQHRLAHIIGAPFAAPLAAVLSQTHPKGTIAPFMPYITNPDGTIMIETTVIMK